MKRILAMVLLLSTLAFGGCASSDDSGSNPGDQPPGEKKDGLGIIPGGAGFKQTF